MKTGRELDALVAEKVMGWIRHEEYPGSNPDGGPMFPGPYWQMPDEIPAEAEREECRPVPAYSTDIAAAWEVVEKLDLLCSDRQPAHMLCRSNGKWHVAWGDTGAGWEFTGDSIEADTAPHAICLAALKAIENPPKS